MTQWEICIELAGLKSLTPLPFPQDTNCNSHKFFYHFHCKLRACHSKLFLLEVKRLHYYIFFDLKVGYFQLLLIYNLKLFRNETFLSNKNEIMIYHELLFKSQELSVPLYLKCSLAFRDRRGITQS